MGKKFMGWMMLLCILCLVYTTPSYATDKQGDNGDGKNIAFDLVDHTPRDGEKEVGLHSEIYLLFNKNVVHFTVKDNNAQCFSLFDDNNQSVPIEIIFADDQIEPDKKREIHLKPQETLREGVTYRVEILPKLQAKNGSTLDKKVSFSFTTVASSTEKIENNSQDTRSTEPQETSSRLEEEANAIEETSTVEENFKGSSVEDAVVDREKNPPDIEEVKEIQDIEINQEDISLEGIEANKEKNNEAVVPDDLGVEKDYSGNSMVYILPILVIVLIVCGFMMKSKAKKEKL